jgi:lipopolysaccharide transport system permease protein
VQTTTDMSARGAIPLPETIIEPPPSWTRPRLRVFWEYRQLLYFFIWRDVKVRYKQTVLGGVWAVLQPLLTMVVFSIFFGRLAGISSGAVPYPVFAYSALVPWMFFANAVSQASSSLVQQERLISKVYFPRVLIPVATVLSGLIDFAIAFCVLIALQIYYGIVPGAAVMLLPLFIVLATVTAVGASLWLSALNVLYRDIRYVVPFLMQFWLFLTPIAYPSSLVPERWQPLYALNPMAGVVEGFRWALLGERTSLSGMLIVSSMIVVGLALSGMLYFQRTETTFADVV